MGLIILGTMQKHIKAFGFAFALVVGCFLASCSQPDIAPGLRPLTKEAMMLLGKKGMKADAPIFVRIFKEDSELEVWKARDDGYYYHFKTYPICTWSGELGPKLAHGDKQAPEGFYTIHKSQMNPNSQFHLAFNLGYPNAYDRSQKRTGDALMVHGKCKSAGCYAMTDALIEEIYALAREHFAAGHDSFPVHAFPFRMSEANLERHKDHRWHPFWLTLKEGYDYFETARQHPTVAVCERRYNVAVKPIQTVIGRLDPEGRCPTLERVKAEPFRPENPNLTAETHVRAAGPKMRALASTEPGSSPGAASASVATSPGPSLGLGSGHAMSGLTKSPPGRTGQLGD